MIDFDVLESVGTTDARLRELLTAMPFSHQRINALKRKGDAESKAAISQNERDVENRRKIETLIASRLDEHVAFSLRNYHFFAAVDLAWDSTPINRSIIPLMLYAQKRINVSQVETSLKSLADGHKYLDKGANGEMQVNLPKFFDCNINLLRSIVTRRLAAQHNKYASLYPWFKYESRANSMVGKLRAEVISQVADQICDNYGWRDTQEQVERDMLLYTTVTTFQMAPWEREVQWRKKPLAAEFEGRTWERESYVVKEGFGWFGPHPNRTFWDRAFPIKSLNTDTGCSYCGFWDVEKFGDIYGNPAYFNRDKISYLASAGWIANNPSFFAQYFDQVKPPPSAVPDDVGTANDTKANVGLYSGEMCDASVITANYYWKIKPNEWGIGDYPFPVWVHFKTAGDGTPILARIMPSTPCAVASFNASNNRLLNNSVAHELLGFNDQLTNLYTQLLETIKADLFSVAVLNEDVFPDTPEGKKVKEDFKSVMSGTNFYAQTQVLMASFAKLGDMGVKLSADNIFKVVRSGPNTQITAIFQAIARVVEMAERLLNLSPQEQGQPAPREITAEETRLIGGTTESVYSFISSALDDWRAAQKRIAHDSFMSCASDTWTLPVLGRYPKDVVKRAGFTLVTEMTDDPAQRDVNEFDVRLNKSALVHEYIYTSRDGADRVSDTQAAKVLVELLQGLGQMNPALSGAVFEKIGKRQLFNILNTIFRQSGAGLDVVLETQPGEDDSLSIGQDEKFMGMIAQVAENVKKNTDKIQQIMQALGGEQPQSPPQFQQAA